MAKKKPCDPLYKDMPAHVQKLWAEHKAHKRAKDRAEWAKRQAK